MSNLFIIIILEKLFWFTTLMKHFSHTAMLASNKTYVLLILIKNYSLINI